MLSPMLSPGNLRPPAFMALAFAALASTTGGLPTKMLALVAQGKTQYTLANVSVPALGDLHNKFDGLPNSCEVLVAVQVSSINPADIYAPGPYPQNMGSDLAGTVLAVQNTCTRLQVGDRVWGDIGAIVHAGGASGKENGAYGQIAVALESQLGAMPRNIDFTEAGALPKVALTSYKALKWYGGAPYASGGTSVLVLGGSGGCGTAGILLAKTWGATQIITTTSADNVEYVAKLGATRVIDYHAENWWDVLPDLSVDVVYDTVGQAGTGDRAMRKLRPGGHHVTIAGAMPLAPRADVHSHSFINSATNLENVDILEELRALVESDELRMKSTQAYPLQAILAAFQVSSEGHVRGKLAVELPVLASGSGQFIANV